MKKNTVKVLLMLAMGFAGGTSYAQNAKQKEWLKQRSDIVRAKEHAVSYTAKFDAELAEAKRMAEINGWPLEIIKDNKYSMLVKVSNEGTPIYLSTFNEGSAITSRSNYLQPGGDLGLDLTGESMEVGVWDGQYPRNTHEDLRGRFTSNDGPMSNVQFHPTHVLGTIMGSGASDITARGIAYNATGTVANFANDFAEMAILSGSIVLSNHSYGIGEPSNVMRGAYMDYSLQVDEVTFDAPYYQPVFAAGNSGNNNNYDIITDRACSKNGIVVAAIEQPSVSTDGTINAANVVLAGFTSWGPTNDNRVKPDIADKGVAVWSCSNSDDTAHAFSDGTSMATPGVTGALLLLQEYFVNTFGDWMLSSTLRALMVNTASEVGADGPDARVGWGVINAKSAAEAITNRDVTSIIHEDILMPLTVYEATVNTTGNEPLNATLAWTDPAGEETYTSESVLVNNLDLRVISNNSGQTTLPWRLATSTSANALRGDNNVDNIEKVQIANPSGSYTIRVSHKGATLVNPATDGTPSQQFSLVITGTDGALSNVPLKIADSSFKLWPNPAIDNVSIGISDSLDENASATIYDVQGRVVRKINLKSQENNFNIQELNSGIYFVNIRNGIKTESKKLIVK